ncbi:Eco57I restriction-modification methylase domain-containing protein [Actinotalea sp. JY-7885]|uniref:Eco57I restriction-modification methylase domain-containing protein n=1 Tax=Actinotalea sp. JY-7885 TaxID=2758576 RepID=UPI00165E70E9|nr:Eco57I restriction-modification methylase domain-containing protein [Actinotalea sp. JY-7885]
MSDALVAVAPTLARDLGARGSRSALAGADPTVGVSSAAAAILAAVPAWWAHRARSAGLDGDWLDVSWAVEAAVPAVQQATPLVGFAALSGSALGRAYVEALDPAVRARHGRHYTPDDLAGRLWDATRRTLGFGVRSQPMPGLVRDPAAGGGALLIPALREHLAATARANPAMSLAGLTQAVHGIDTDPAAAWLASVVLAAECLPTIAEIPARLRHPVPQLVHVGDGLAPASLARVALMNPPYGRVKLSVADRNRWDSVLLGHANLYALFMAHGAESLERDGVLAALVPTSWTSGLYFSRLRELLGSDLTLRSVTFVESRGGVFSGVLQETCLAVFSKRKARYTNIALSNGAVHPVARVPAPRGSGPWLLPRRGSDAPVAAAAASMPLTLARAGWRVSTGPLVWNRRKDDLHARTGKGRAPILWGADIATGAVRRDRTRNQQRYLKIRDAADRRTMVLDTPAVLVQRTTAPEQTRRLVVADLPPEVLATWGGEIIVENHVNVLRPVDPEPMINRATLARVLATTTLDRVMRSLSGSVAVSAFELSALPLPDAATLRGWCDLEGEALERAVARAYGERSA